MKGYRVHRHHYINMLAQDEVTVKNVNQLVQAQPVAAISASGLTFKLLNGIANGDGSNLRDGRVVELEKLEIRFAHGLPKVTGATAGDADSMRIIIFVDRSANGAAPVTTDLLLTTATYLSPYNLFNSSRFCILYDDMLDHMHSAGDATDWGEDRTSERLSINIEGLETIYKGTGSAITDISSNSLWIAYGTKRGLSGLDFYTRLWFHDE